LGEFIIIYKKNTKLILVFIIVVGFIIPNSAYAISISDNIFEKNTINVLQPDWYYKPDDYDELVSWYKTLESSYPDYIEVFKANELYDTGVVDGGYDLYYVRVTNETLGLDKPEVLFMGGPHGDETVGTIGLYWFCNWLMRKAFTDEPCETYSKEWLRWIVDNREIYIVVSHNPYGFDENIRFDNNGWDLNREADYDGPGDNTGGIWASVNGRTLRSFINDHMIRVGCDFHGGVRMLLYPWSSTYDNVVAISKITGQIFTHVPPDFEFYDASTLRLGKFIGNYGGSLDKRNIGTIPDTVGYEAPGAIAPWGYGSDVEQNPSEDPFVDDETFGNYPGSGILWVTPEMSRVKNPAESTFGSDDTSGFGPEVRRFVLHQTDLAQPYVRWNSESDYNNKYLPLNSSIVLKWQVNGSICVDHTSLIYNNEETNDDYIWAGENLADENNQYIGGTGWDDASDGKTSGVTYEQELFLDEPGEYYFYAKAKVDQYYKNVLDTPEYEGDSYLRIINERTNNSFYEQNNGTDGINSINGRIFWYSPVVHITVGDKTPSYFINIPKDGIYFNNKRIFDINFLGKPLIIGSLNLSVDILSGYSSVRSISFYINDNLMKNDDEGLFFYNWDEKGFGRYEIKIVIDAEYETITKVFNVYKFL